MKKYKLNTENKSKTPTPKSMDAQKDFGKLFHDYNNLTKKPKKPIYKNPKYFLVLIVIMLLAYVVVEAVNKDEKEKNKLEQSK